MKPGTLKRLDPWLQFPAALTGRAVSSLARRSGISQDRALIVRPGGMGDLVLLCLAMEEMKLALADFTWLIERRSLPWAELLGLRSLCYDDGPVKAIRSISGRFRLVINTEQLYGLSQAAALAALGPNGKLVSFDTNRASRWASVRVPYDPIEAHEALEFSRLIATALQSKALAQAPERTRVRTSSGVRAVAIAGRQSRSRLLPDETWLSLTREWAPSGGIAVLSAPEDRDFARALAERLGDRARAHEGTFAETCALISAAEELLAMDGGLLHVGSYFGIPTTAIFTSSRERKWAPLASGSRLIRRADLPCQPCAMFAQVPPCPYGFACTELDFRRHLRPR